MLDSEIPLDIIFSVSEYLDALNRSLKQVRAKILGEVSGIQEYPGRSYLYFSIKDKKDGSTAKCFMWKQDYKNSGVFLEEGMEVVITAYPNVYKPNGGMTLQVESIELVGEGALKIAYEKLKTQLEKEGLFDERRKKIIPLFPHRIGIITSKSGAVINDFLSNIGKNGFEIIFVDSKVEGEGAVKDILSALRTFYMQKVDVLVLMRGGGSLESFQAFNNELVVRAVSKFNAPVVTGIGHDKDVPLVSLVSDKNVSTPTAVANLLSEGYRGALSEVRMSEVNLFSLFEHLLRDKRYVLEEGERIMEKSFRSIFDTFENYFNALKRAEDSVKSAIQMAKILITTKIKELVHASEAMVVLTRTTIVTAERYLDARNPERQLRLGWSIARNKEGKVIRSINEVKEGDNFDVMVADGSISVTKI